MNLADTCGRCHSDMSCSVLSTALRIAETLPDLADRPALVKLVQSIKEKLAAAQWHYPDSKELCVLAGQDHTMQQMTAALIVELQASRHQCETPHPPWQHANHPVGGKCHD